MRPGSYYRALLTHYLEIRPGEGWTLDVGAGDGQVLAGMSGVRTVALDPRPDRVPGQRTVRGDGRAAPFAAAGFSTVLALDVLEHVEDDATLITELFRLTSPGGTLWLSVPSRDMALFPAFLTGPAHRAWGHVRPGYTRDQLLALLPPGLDVTVFEWNEPCYRLCYPALRVAGWVAPSFARLLLGMVARWDNARPAGIKGHFFCRVRLPAP